VSHCVKCGATIGADAPFCSVCGSPQAAGATYPPPPPPADTPPLAVPPPTGGEPGEERSQMKENIAATLCYALLWVTGIIFYLIDKRPFVRFHAAQSIVVFGVLQVASWVVATMFGTHLRLLYSLIDAVEVILWIVLMTKAYQGERFRVPLAADIVDQLFGKI
jgi:uncharacterized membrane protein